MINFNIVFNNFYNFTCFFVQFLFFSSLKDYYRHNLADQSEYYRNCRNYTRNVRTFLKGHRPRLCMVREKHGGGHCGVPPARYGQRACYNKTILVVACATEMVGR